MTLANADPVALQHSNKVKQHLQESIRQAGGAISFAEFMEQVLYTPGLGYYSAGCFKLGEQGDFITAPEISTLFSQTLAHALYPVCLQLHKPGILEVGAGSGKMAAGILRELVFLNCELDHYYILERSAELRQRQFETLETQIPKLLHKITWLDHLPDSYEGIVLGNELLDAMPVHRFRKTNTIIKELMVACDNDTLIYVEQDCSNFRLIQHVENIEHSLQQEFVAGYCSEVNLAAMDWLHSIASMLQKGFILLLDYGYPMREYYHAQREQGTLSCYYQHQRHDDVFHLPGLQDITAHIDFSSLADTVINNNGDVPTALQLVGYTNQAQFLLANGITDIVSRTAVENIKQQLIVSQQIKKLTMPHEMGELIKVIGFQKSLQCELGCFMAHDLSHLL